MPAHNVIVGQVIVGQRIDPAKVERAKELRRQMTPEERILWRLLRARRLNGLHFRRQQVIDGFIVDFYCHAAGLVVEVDGGIHAEQPEYDAERDCILSARGLRILRVTNEDVRRDAATVLRRIAAACTEGQPLPPTPSPARGGGDA
jgi:very-short-patch-repair endonuclease